MMKINKIQNRLFCHLKSVCVIYLPEIEYVTHNYLINLLIVDVRQLHLKHHHLYRCLNDKLLFEILFIFFFLV